MTFDDPVAIICDEEAKLTGKELNRALRDEDGQIYDIVAGSFLIAGLGEEDFCSLTPEQIKKFSDMYKTPEMFLRLNGKLMVLPMEEKRELSKKPSVLQKLNDLKDKDAPAGIKKLLIKFASPLSPEKSHPKRQTRSVMTLPLGFSKANMPLWYVRTQTRLISITT